MNANSSLSEHPITELHGRDIDAAIDAACKTIAPSWPLDRFIAVSPYWGLIDRSFAQVDTELARLAGSSLYMPRAFYRAAFAQGRFTQQHVATALAEVHSAQDAAQLIDRLERSTIVNDRFLLLSECIDAAKDLRREPAWQEAIAHQISQFCAAYFDNAQADWRPTTQSAVPLQGNMYSDWRIGMVRDHSVAPLMHAPEVAQRAQQLPGSARAAIAQVVIALDITADKVENFLRATLLRIGGWAGWCAYLRWQARLADNDDEHIVELMAIRLAWEYLLDDGLRDTDSLWAQWQRNLHSDTAAPQRDEAIYQRALEIAYQQALARELASAPRATVSSAPITPSTTTAQAIFCIDVRSEVFRRALENVAPSIRTHGFAGFFGLPINYTPLGTAATRPQLPGLLAPVLNVTDSCGRADEDIALQRKRTQRLGARAALLPFKRLPASAFALVEALGITAIGQLLRRSLPSGAALQHSDRAGLTAQQVQRARPRLDAAVNERAELALRILRTMSLGDDLARLVLLVGHGNHSTNNPHAAGLDCGACCGQTGEVNARVLAALLNDAAVRSALAEMGAHISPETYFVAALHNTTTDQIELFESDLLPDSHAQDLARLTAALRAAGARARAERAPQLGLAALAHDDKVLQRAISARANDWAQTRPEWGLANNAAFIVAPRARSQHVNLHGRCFLHDYDWRRDVTGSVLELIMTAPMIVAHWINMQYLASTADNRRYGSGNKVLHNVVGGHIGVFEGNGGDLRIGLPLQSLHDGTRWMHTPLRLSVFIEAPRTPIDVAIAKHASVRQLLDNNWLYLFRIDSATNSVECYRDGKWHPAVQQAELSNA